jgi:hypothetical protein
VYGIGVHVTEVPVPCGKVCMGNVCKCGGCAIGQFHTFQGELIDVGDASGVVARNFDTSASARLEIIGKISSHFLLMPAIQKLIIAQLLA